MKIVVIGAGAIGNLVAAYLKLKNTDVSLVGNIDSVSAIKENGIELTGPRGSSRVSIDIDVELKIQPDLAILATKTQDLERALENNRDLLKGALVLTTQNGIRSDALAAKYIPRDNIISSIVMFGATYLDPGKVIHNFEGSWIIGKAFGKNDSRVVEVSNELNKIFPTIVAEDIRGMKYLKIFVNANNCIPAVLGQSMQEAFSDLGISRLSICLWKEGLQVVEACGIDLVSLPDFPLERVTNITGMPTLEAAKVLSGIMTNLSKEPLYGSILQSIKRGRSSEIDYINGEFVVLAKEHNLNAPLNEKMVELVHRVENTNKFLSHEELIEETEEFVN